MAFTRRTGLPRGRKYNAAGTIAKHDLVQLDENGEVVVAATGAEVLGIALEAGTSSTEVLVDILSPGDEVNATISTGTMATAEIGEEADLEDENSLTLTESNNDFLILGWDNYVTTECWGVLKNLATGA